ncbi:MAG TPA: malate dehydrogenase [Candidatus Nitrosotenuis sp.]|jgi:L-lactate dehydrogenase|nr:malate dehydrogenase [Candidatus Nitrosotenuis sp.]
MKVSIIGGAGRVGSNAAFALQLRGFISDLVLLDVNQEGAAGEALDLLHGAAMTHPVRVRSGGYEAVEGSDMVVVTAGLRRKPDESRLDLINRNVDLFLSILGEVRKVPLPPEAILLVVTNPVDILTHLAVERSGFPAQKVLGLGTLLDTLRFRSLLADWLGVAATQVDALILGEHGDSMVPIWSSATVDGVPLSSLPGYDASGAAAVFARTRGSGAEVIRLKGGAGYAVGVAIAQVVEAVARDSRALLPVSTLQTGLFGIRDICLSVPTRVGRKGAEEQVAIALWPREEEALRGSADSLKETLAKVQVGRRG